MGSTSSVVGKTNYSTIEGNRCEGSSGYGAAVFHDGQKPFLFEYCNFLKNYQQITTNGAFGCYSASSMTINQCSFLNDQGRGKLFYSGPITIKNSHVDKLTSSGNKVVQQSVDKNNITNSLTFYCNENMFLMFLKHPRTKHRKLLLNDVCYLFKITCELG